MHTVSQKALYLAIYIIPTYHIHSCVCFRRNILPELKDTDLKGCIYNRYKNPYCPIFRLGDIVSEAKENFGDMAVEVKPYFYNLRVSNDV